MCSDAIRWTSWGWERSWSVIPWGGFRLDVEDLDLLVVDLDGVGDFCLDLEDLLFEGEGV